MKENIIESGQKPMMSFKDASEFHAFLYEKRSKDALLAVAEMSKHPASLEDKIKQTHRIQAQLRNPRN